MLQHSDIVSENRVLQNPQIYPQYPPSELTQKGLLRTHLVDDNPNERHQKESALRESLHQLGQSNVLNIKNR
jgi:hypothetical protein